MESSKHPTKIYTDHILTVKIVMQTSITTNTPLIRHNQRHQRSSQHLSTFSLEVCHKLGKNNVVPDAVSGLEAKHKNEKLLENRDVFKLQLDSSRFSR